MRVPSAGLLLMACALCAQDQHATWTLAVDPATARPGGKVLIKMTGAIEPGWHLYSMSTPAANPTKVVVTGPAVDKVRALQAPFQRSFDPNFNSDTEFYEGAAVFLFEVTLKPDATPGPSEMVLKASYQTCNPKQCVPSKWTGTASVTIAADAPAYTPAIPPNFHEPAPVAASSVASAQAQGLGAFLLVAFGFGLASIFTPCVFPMIPITMSYFLNRESGGRKESLVQAVVFCLGIVVLFSGMGLAITALLGPFGIVQLGSNPWVNGFITVLFIVFGLSLLGAFEITIPSVILTRLNQSAGQGGFIGSLLMGLTFSLASFACVGPFVGTLLAASVSDGGSRPLIGMVTFATGLALPFFLLALFPSYLQRMPRAGGWMARIKVVMGFIILAASLKYLSSLDQVLQWGVLTRERFLAAWIVLFALPGLYLLGFLRMEGIKPDEPLGIGRLLPGAALLIFAISLIPGMTGAKLGDLDAYVPLAAQNSAGGAVAGGLAWMKNQYREALDRARREGKLVLINFTGYACTNCHWMKANMFTRPEIAAAMNGYVLLELYTDGTDASSEENQKVQLAKFKTVAIPFYAIVDPDENVVATFPSLTKDPAEYLAFLSKGPAPTTADTQSPEPLSELPLGKGRVAVVNFWATWCVPCIKEIPSFNRIHKEFGPKGVTVIGVSMDEDGPAPVRKFLQDHRMEYGVFMGARAFNDQYKLEPLPITLIFDRAGKQVKRFEGLTEESEFLAAVRAAL